MSQKNIGYIGLGKMGSNMVERLLEKGWRVVVFDKNKEAVQAAVAKGTEARDSVAEVVAALEGERLVWVMVPSSAAGAVLEELTLVLKEGDTVIDGGNTFYKDSIERARLFSEKGIHFLDVGVSGGPSGAREGACMMVGGERQAFEKYEPIFQDLCVAEGYAHVGGNGAGHFVKMVHNGIEYGMMQAIAEGFAVMKQSEFDLNPKSIAGLYTHGSVIESRLVDWLKKGFEEYGEELSDISGSVGASGEGEWTVNTAEELGVAVPVIKAALDFRAQSKQSPSYTGKILSTLRNIFGGHSVQK